MHLMFKLRFKKRCSLRHQGSKLSVFLWIVSVDETLIWRSSSAPCWLHRHIISLHIRTDLIQIKISLCKSGGQTKKTVSCLMQWKTVYTERIQVRTCENCLHWSDHGKKQKFEMLKNKQVEQLRVNHWHAEFMCRPGTLTERVFGAEKQK